MDEDPIKIGRTGKRDIKKLSIDRVIKEQVTAYAQANNSFPSITELREFINSTSHLHGLIIKSDKTLKSHLRDIQLVPAENVCIIFTPDILWALTQKAMSGIVASQTLWMQIFWPDVMRKSQSKEIGQGALTLEQIREVTEEGIRRFNDINLTLVNRN